MKSEPAEIKALAQARLFDEIMAKVVGDDPVYSTTAQMAALAVQLLISARQYGPSDEGKAGVALTTALQRFPGSVRLRQMRGLLWRRTGQLEKAQYELTKLLEESQRDSETLGMLAAVWADQWEQLSREGEEEEARDALEQAQSLYEEGFRKVPTDTYAGLNAASKAAMLGDLVKARELAARLLGILQEQADARGGTAAADYWERVCEPEALLLLGEEERACAPHHDARVAHQTGKGSLESTALQIRRLLAMLTVSAETQAKLIREFRIKE